MLIAGNGLSVTLLKTIYIYYMKVGFIKGRKLSGGMLA